MLGTKQSVLGKSYRCDHSVASRKSTGPQAFKSVGIEVSEQALSRLLISRSVTPLSRPRHFQKSLSELRNFRAVNHACYAIMS